MHEVRVNEGKGEGGLGRAGKEEGGRGLNYYSYGPKFGVPYP